MEKKFYDREITICRQSQQKLALDLAVLNGIKVSVRELQRMTDVLVECCIRPMDDSLKNRIKEMDKWIEEKKSSMV